MGKPYHVAELPVGFTGQLAPLGDLVLGLNGMVGAVDVHFAPESHTNTASQLAGLPNPVSAGNALGPDFQLPDPLANAAAADQDFLDACRRAAIAVDDGISAGLAAGGDPPAPGLLGPLTLGAITVDSGTSFLGPLNAGPVEGSDGARNNPGDGDVGRRDRTITQITGVRDDDNEAVPSGDG